MDETTYHRAVLVEEIMELLACKSGDTVIDGTLGSGGHAKRILDATAPGGRLIGIDRDPEARSAALENLKEYGDRLLISDSRHEELTQVMNNFGVPSVDGFLLDLGISSRHVDSAERGFSFRQDGPLDMRMDPSSELTAADVLNDYSEEELSRTFLEWGEERWAKRISQFVVERRGKTPYESTEQLVETVKAAIPARARRAAGGHPARRVFQALRIEVNDEIVGLADTVRAATDALNTGGRGAIISYHSLEDRVVKWTLRELKQDQKVAIITKRPIRPSEEEVEGNSRARSALLRVWEKVS